MCHRYRAELRDQQVAELLQVQFARMAEFPERDLYPAKEVPVIRQTEDEDWEMVSMSWGLLPFWWKPGRTARSSFQKKTFNARAETVHKLPSFRAAFKSRRCLIPASGFYEGQKGHVGFFHLADSAVMTFAGLWESCRVDGETIESCTIVTTGANELVSQYHPRDRMPVILPDPESRRLWMSFDVVEREPLEGLFEPIDSSLMSHRDVEG